MKNITKIEMMVPGLIIPPNYQLHNIIGYFTMKVNSEHVTH